MAERSLLTGTEGEIIKQATIDALQLREGGVEVARDVALAPFTTIKIGGPADYFAIVTNTRQLQTLVQWARSANLPYFLLGGGSNILISDAGIRGLVIYNRCRRIELLTGEAATAGAPTDAVLRTESGAAMAGAARQSVRHGYSGLEWAVSLPGTVGGAVVGNAGAHGGEIKDSLIQTDIITETGDIASLSLEELAYSYRHSTLKRRSPLQAGFHPVVLEARFRLSAANPEAVRATADRYLSHRRCTQPVEPSLGSTFMNPPGDFAGRLIEEAGLTGMRVGGVEISRVHANFIINPGGIGHASAADFMRLVRRVQEEVRRQFAVDLVPEIQLAGEW